MLVSCIFLPQMAINVNLKIYKCPDQVEALNDAGKQTGEYWHPDHLLHMTHAE